MSTEQDPYEEGKRAGLHPLIVLFGAILVMWLLINLAVPSGKTKAGRRSGDFAGDDRRAGCGPGHV